MRKKLPLEKKRGLTAQQLEAVNLLASDCTPRFTALALKIPYSTINRWLKHNKPFQAELTAQQQALFLRASEKRIG